ncbi:MAG: hypothetical protein ABIG11_07820 [bacterium]
MGEITVAETVKSGSWEEADLKLLTDKMVLLMEKISEYGFLTIREVGLIYSNQTHAYRVLNALKDKGLIRYFRTSLKPRTAFSLTRKAYWFLEQNERLRVKSRFCPENYLPYLFKHRTACAAVGIMLERHPLIKNYCPESLLWAKRKQPDEKVCDAEFWFKKADRNESYRVGLEVELTLKNREKLVNSFRGLSRRTDLEYIWWICGDNTVCRALADCVRRGLCYAPQGHFMAPMDALLRDGSLSRLSDPDENSYYIDHGEWPPKAQEPQPCTKSEQAKQEEPHFQAPTPPDNASPTQDRKAWEDGKSRGREYGRAEAESTAEPAKPIQKPAESRLYRILRGIRKSWNWLMDSWGPEEFYDNNGYRRVRTCFKRWGLVITLFLLSVAGASGYYLIKYPWLIEYVKAGKIPKWQTRRLDAEIHRGNNWRIKLESLRSIGGLYRLKVDIYKEKDSDRKLSRVSVHAYNGDMLRRWDTHPGEKGASLYQDRILEFQGPIFLRGVNLILVEDYRSDRERVTVADVVFE